MEFARTHIVARIPEAPSPRFGINRLEFLRVVAESFNAKKIDLYQGALLLDINCNRPTVDHIDHPLRLIELHNDPQVDFSHKVGSLLQSLMDSKYYTYDELKDSGILQIEPGSKLYFTMADIYTENGIRLAEARAMHTDGLEREEVTQQSLLAPNLIQKSFSAIPKQVFLRLITEAMKHSRMNYMQAMMMFSVNCHSLELRRNGHRYLDHPMAVANDQRLTKDQRFIALIHDMIENSNYTLEDLRQAGLPDFVIVAVDGLTIRDHEKDDFDSMRLVDLAILLMQGDELRSGYYAFIERCSRNMHSLAVKMADIYNNMQDAKPHKKLEYLVAYGYLDAVSKGQIKPGMPVHEWVAANPDLDLAAIIDFNLGFKKGTSTLMRDVYPEVINRKLAKIQAAIDKIEGNIPAVPDSDHMGMLDLLNLPASNRSAGLDPADPLAGASPR